MEHICKYCGKKFEKSSQLGGHIVSCKDNPNRRTPEKCLEIGRSISNRTIYKIYNLICETCGNIYQLKLSDNAYNKKAYKKTCSKKCAAKLTIKNTDNIKKSKKISDSLKKRAIPFRKIRYCRYCNAPIKYGSKSGYCCVEHMKLSRSTKLKNIAKTYNFGGYNPNSIKKHKTGNYKGIHCDSSWELAYVVYCLEHNIKIERCKEVRYYTINGITKKYFPDFTIKNTEIIEIKGYCDNSAKLKQEQNPDITFLFWNDLQEILNYIISKYGKHFWEKLYE